VLRVLHLRLAGTLLIPLLEYHQLDKRAKEKDKDDNRTALKA